MPHEALYALSTLYLAALSTVAQTVHLSISSAPPAGTQTPSGSLQGCPMEGASFADMAYSLTCGAFTLMNH